MGKLRTGFTTFERAFIDRYTTTHIHDGLGAVRAAGHEGTDENCKRLAWRMMKRPRIRRAIDRRLAGHIAGHRELLSHISDVATAPWRDFVQVRLDEEGRVVDAKLNLGDKLRAAETLLKHHGKLVDPATRAIDTLMQREILGMLRAQKQATRKLVLKKKRQLRQLPAGSPGAAPLDLAAQVVEPGHEPTKHKTK